MTINELVEWAHANSKDKGFWDGENHNIGEKLMLIVSEAAEALESAREFPDYIHQWADNGNGKPVGFPTELIDIIIRTADLIGHLGFNAEQLLVAKMEYNSTRSHKHGKAF